jgi:hypothetical protein
MTWRKAMIDKKNRLNDQSENDVDKTTSQTAWLIHVCDNVELFHTADGETYASVTVNEHKEIWKIQGSEFRNWLRHRFYTRFKSGPSNLSLQEALCTIAAKAQFEGPEVLVHLRIAEQNGKIYVDLVNQNWEVVEICPSGWRVLKESPVKFRRSKKMKSLPYPISNPDVFCLNGLKEYLNAETDDDFKLIVAFIMNAYNPFGPYLVLILYGEQGNAKTTTAIVTRSLVDPNQVPLRKEPRDSDSLLVSAKHNWIIAVDNMSFLSDSLSDDFCRLATGGGISKRSLYTNDEETVLEAKRPLILNGISEFVSRGDLASRSVIINLPQISEKKRKREKLFWEEFRKAQPVFLGCLFNGISAALRNEGQFTLDTQERMADSWHWVTASEEAFGWKRGSIIDAFKRNKKTANEVVLNNSSVVPYIRELAAQGWCGSPTDLLSKLNAMRGANTWNVERFWPKHPKTLTDHLRRINPSLRLANIEVILDGKTAGNNSERRITIRTLPQSSDAFDAQTSGIRKSEERDEGDGETQRLKLVSG